MNTATLDALGNKLANAALTTLVRLCPEVRTASEQQLEAACAAMRAKSGEAIDELLKDTRAAPHLAHVSFTSAVLTLATEGVKVLRGV